MPRRHEGYAVSRVVSNTSPLTNLAAIGRLDLLTKLFGRLDIADAVWEELNAQGQSWPGREAIARASWVTRHSPGNHALVVALQRDLDRGEAHSIALAVELGAGLILLDEREGRRAAQRQGLRPMGVVGVLLLAKARGLLHAIRPELDALRADAGFWLGDAVYRLALEKAHEAL
jgi:predicted nucleic acid-binding protein